MTKQGTWKLLALFLVMLMCFGMFPGTALAADGNIPENGIDKRKLEVMPLNIWSPNCECDSCDKYDSATKTWLCKSGGSADYHTCLCNILDAGITVQIGNTWVDPNDPNACENWYKYNISKNQNSISYFGNPNAPIDFPLITGDFTPEAGAESPQAHYVYFSYLNLNVGEWAKNASMAITDCNVEFTEPNDTIRFLTFKAAQEEYEIKNTSDVKFSKLSTIGAANKEHFEVMHSLTSKPLAQATGMQDKYGEVLSIDDIKEILGDGFDTLIRLFITVPTLEEAVQTVKSNAAASSSTLERMSISYDLPTSSFGSAATGDITNFVFDMVYEFGTQKNNFSISGDVVTVGHSMNTDFPALYYTLGFKAADNAKKWTEVGTLNAEVNLSDFTMSGSGERTGGRYPYVKEYYTIQTSNTSFQQLGETNFSVINIDSSAYKDTFEIRRDANGVGYVVLKDRNTSAEVLPNGLAPSVTTEYEYIDVEHADGSTETLLVKKNENGTVTNANSAVDPVPETTYIPDSGKGKEVVDENNIGYITGDGNIYVPDKTGNDYDGTMTKYEQNEDGTYTGTTHDGTSTGTVVIIPDHVNEGDLILIPVIEQPDGSYKDVDDNEYVAIGSGEGGTTSAIVKDSNGVITLPDGTVVNGIGAEEPTFGTDEAGKVDGTIDIPENSTITRPDGTVTIYPDGADFDPETGKIVADANTDGVSVDLKDGDITITEDSNGNLIISQPDKNDKVISKDTEITVKDTGSNGDTITVDGTDVNLGNITGNLVVENGGTANVSGSVTGDVAVEPGSEADITGQVDGNLTNNGGTVTVGNGVTGNVSTDNSGETIVIGNVGGNVISDHGGETNISGDVTGDVKTDNGALTEINGNVEGEVDNSNRGQTYVDGDVDGDINNSDKGSQVVVGGNAGNDIINDGGSVSIDGNVTGNVNTNGSGANTSVGGAVGGNNNAVNGGTANEGVNSGYTKQLDGTYTKDSEKYIKLDNGDFVAAIGPDTNGCYKISGSDDLFVPKSGNIYRYVYDSTTDFYTAPGGKLYKIDKNGTLVEHKIESIDLADGDVTITKNGDQLIISQAGKPSLNLDKDTIITVNDTRENPKEMNTVTVDGADVAFSEIDGNLKVKNGGVAAVEGNVMGTAEAENGSSYDVKGVVKGNHITGDVNGDRYVTILDLELLHAHLDGSNLLANVSMGDVNGDGTVTILDLELLHAHLDGSNLLV